MHHGSYHLKECNVRCYFVFAWYDLWMRAYWDRVNKKLYVLPLPCVGVVIQFGKR